MYAHRVLVILCPACLLPGWLPQGHLVDLPEQRLPLHVPVHGAPVCDLHGLQGAQAVAEEEVSGTSGAG